MTSLANASAVRNASAARLLAAVSWQMERAQGLVLCRDAAYPLSGNDVSVILIRQGRATLGQPAGLSLQPGDVALVGEPTALFAVDPIVGVHLTLRMTGSQVAAKHLPRFAVIPGFTDIEPAIAGLINGNCSDDHVPQPIDSLICGQAATIVMTAVLRAWLRCVEQCWPGGDPFLNEVIAAIHEFPARAWTVADLAAVGATSRTVFAQRFTAALGISPMRYLAEVRMQLAADHLRAGKSVAETARQIGYVSEGFSRAFRRRFGAPPSRWQTDLSRADHPEPDGRDQDETTPARSGTS